MRKWKAAMSMLGSVFVKGILQWRLLAAVGIVFIFVNRYAIDLGNEALSNGIEKLHYLEAAASMYAGASGVTALTWIAILIWMSDAPFFNQSEALVVYRTGKRLWILTRLAYMVVGSGLFLLLDGVLVTLLALPYAGGEGLSEMFLNRSPYFGNRQLAAMTPQWAACMGFLLNWMAVLIFALLMFAVNMRRSRGVGLAVSMLYWGFDSMYFLMMYSLFRDSRFMLVSPAYLKNVLNLASRYTPPPEGGSPTLTAALIYMGAVIAILIAVILLLTPGYPFPFIKNRESRPTD